MINVLFKTSNSKILSFKIKGHANLSNLGTDIVCSAVSSTTLMTINGIIEILHLNPKYVIDEGYTLCDLSNTDVDKCQDFLKSYYVFIEELASEYPKNIKFKVMEV